VVIFLSSVVAGAAVRVEDPHGCLELDSLDLEARDALGDDVVERYDIYARVSSSPGSDARELHLAVAEDGITVWRRDVHVEEVDCPYLSSLVVLSVERGLSEVPKWVLERGASAKLGSELGVLGFLTTPTDAIRFGATVTGSTGVGPRLRLRAGLDLYTIAPQEIGLGTVTVYGLALAPGFSYDLLRWGRWVSIRPGAQLGAGPAWLVGQDFGTDPDSVAVRPRWSATVDTTFAMNRNLRLVALLEIPIEEVKFALPGTGEVVDEPALRVGAAIGAVLPSRRE